MSLASDLLSQADQLARGGGSAGRPRQADLRRAVSAAYYAVFHTITEAAGRQLLARHRQTIRRFITHAGLKAAATAFSGSTPSQRIKPLVPANIKRSIREVAQSCRDLYELRQQADYDYLMEFDRKRSLESVELARQALASWARARRKRGGGSSPQARSFLAAVILLSASRPD